uniref:Uncharacterized protein n=1 Tax=Setaria viridis TaxID=4556 RepID=A0A4U6UJT0_SETVI|nr:hypothetical protein SEVIR_6G193250v2 [Setaria viridis]
MLGARKYHICGLCKLSVVVNCKLNMSVKELSRKRLTYLTVVFV